VGNGPLDATDPSGLRSPADRPWFDAINGNKIEKPVNETGWVKSQLGGQEVWVHIIEGAPQFKKYARTTLDGSTSFQFAPTGTSKGDIDALDRKMTRDGIIDVTNGKPFISSAENNAQKSWTWHHVSFDRETGRFTMMLVPYDLHHDISHDGGFKQYMEYVEDIIQDASKAAQLSPEMAAAIRKTLNDEKLRKQLSSKATKSMNTFFHAWNPLASTTAEDIINRKVQDYNAALAKISPDTYQMIETTNSKGLKSLVFVKKTFVRVLGIATAIELANSVAAAADGRIEDAAKGVADVVEPLPITAVNALAEYAVIPVTDYVLDEINFGSAGFHKTCATRMGVDPTGLFPDQDKGKGEWWVGNTYRYK
jgi:hypothetical protein